MLRNTFVIKQQIKTLNSHSSRYFSTNTIKLTSSNNNQIFGKKERAEEEVWARQHNEDELVRLHNKLEEHKKSLSETRKKIEELRKSIEEKKK
ncbi:uncharacterized protein BX663DRAFT_507358 [Cokeromyces recurvatus]|uniref:uncharacterized protein n=1 Tax=Cokeromyces recurvatus TaxID=90255 RepID=UPI00221EFD2A|nr:uncharacterized protein BX663DRAFT_507358 [Cokeromyces recurvatus]KAI7903716.1 hypothetical protein BX663DRAFT_507358 [Cokeromyces recurvatus]